MIDGLSSVYSEEVLLIDPCLSALVAFEDQFEELEDYCQPLKIGKRSYVFIPVNDKSDKFLPVGGSHWALLVLEVKTQEFYYYDSTGGVISMANELARKFLSVLRAEPIETNSEAKFNRVKDSSRQKNGYDCGMYLLLNTQNLLQSLNNGEKLDSTKPLVPTIIPTQVTKARSDIKKLISDLINQKASSNKV